MLHDALSEALSESAMALFKLSGLAASRSIWQHLAASRGTCGILCCKASAHEMRYQKADEYAALLG
jgi:hypothetical protein